MKDHNQKRDALQFVVCRTAEIAIRGFDSTCAVVRLACHHFLQNKRCALQPTHCAGITSVCLFY
jgi:hypothetical protein